MAAMADRTAAKKEGGRPPDGRPAYVGADWSPSRIIPIDTGVMEIPELAVVGQPVPRIDGPMKVSGLQMFGADYYPPGMLHVKAVRSPHPHAKVVAIDGSEALKIPGVKAVITAADIKGINRHGLAGPNRPALVPVGDNVRYIGDPVALVAAETLEQLEAGIQALQVDYKLLPAVFDPAAALQPGA